MQKKTGLVRTGDLLPLLLGPVQTIVCSLKSLLMVDWGYKGPLVGLQLCSIICSRVWCTVTCLSQNYLKKFVWCAIGDTLLALISWDSLTCPWTLESLVQHFVTGLMFGRFNNLDLVNVAQIFFPVQFFCIQHLNSWNWSNIISYTHT